MEVDEIQRQVCKFQKIGNGSSNGTSHDARKVVQKGEIDQPHDGRYYPDDEEDGVLVKRGSSTGGSLAGGIDILGGSSGGGRLYGWPSSRIVRVSRASGGKDRHSKVLTSKGLRDRRVRLSVTTAIQFYDLQDRLGYDQPSKAVEWLLKAASSSIAELPSLNPAFPDTPKQLSDEIRSSENTEPGFESTEVELDGDPNFQHHQQGQNQNVSLSKSACSSTSETSKGSGLSLSRSESRIKARERARERAAEKEKEKENDSSQQGVVNHQNLSPISQNSSFTELLTAGISSVGGSNGSPNGSAHHNSGGGGGGNGGESSMVNKSRAQWTPPMDYLSTGIFAPLSSRGHTSSGFPGHTQLGNSLPHFNISTTTGDHHHHPELQHFSFVPENFVSASGNSESYNLNFSISSSGLAGFNRGTLQSNSPSLLPPHLQRFPSIDGSNLPFFIGSSTTAASNATASVENHHHHHNQHHQLPAGFDAGLQLFYGDNPAGRHSDHKGKGKN